VVTNPLAKMSLSFLPPAAFAASPSAVSRACFSASKSVRSAHTCPPDSKVTPSFVNWTLSKQIRALPAGMVSKRTVSEAADATFCETAAGVTLAGSSRTRILSKCAAVGTDVNCSEKTTITIGALGESVAVSIRIAGASWA
jgi:hypothetical protein